MDGSENNISQAEEGNTEIVNNEKIESPNESGTNINPQKYEDLTKGKGVVESEKSTEFASLVAAHYNSLEKYDTKSRYESKIFYLRNFNNWIKSELIKSSVKRLPESETNIKVLDMCCGKGGDLLKWLKSNTRYLICADIAEISLEEYKSRFKALVEEKRRQTYLECEFIVADCTRVRLRGKYKDPSIQLNIVSCQFCFHYCFESLPQAECMLKNASECLKAGGLFIGTIPNAYEIIKRLRKSNSNQFGNDIFKIEMCCTKPYPLFGAKYNFYLEGVVNCPEFLVHFPTFEKLALKFGLKLVKREQFSELFKRSSTMYDGKELMKRMKALEPYPPREDKELNAPKSDYIHAELYCKETKGHQVGTLSRSEWEVASLYQTFIFEKIKPE